MSGSTDNFVFPSQQTKRKLDDANKRLEALYDKLREQTVSAVQLRFKRHSSSLSDGD